jgi:hypothetical protein
VPQCVHRDLAAGFGGGGPALGYLDAVVRFVDIGRGCRISGWPTLTAVIAGHSIAETRRTTSSPAADGGIDLTPVATVRLEPGQVAYVIIDGTDDPPDGDRSCPPFDRFVIRLPGMSEPFSLTALAPGYLPRFPDCGSLGRTPVLPASDVIAKQRQPRP